MKDLRPPYPAIRNGLHAGRVIPFLGSGASLGGTAKWRKESARRLPTARDLARHLAHDSTFPDQPEQLATVAQYYCVAVGPDALRTELHRIFDRDYPLLPLHRYLAAIPEPLLVVTTNYDDLIERAFTDAKRPYDLVVHTTDPAFGDKVLWRPHGALAAKKVSPNKLDLDLGSHTVIYKMHGTVDRGEPKRDQY